LLRRFEALAASPYAANEADVEALAIGWRQWWRDGRSEDLCAMAERLPGELVEADRRLASYLGAARLTRRRAATA
jgi:hypothetical protein